MSMTSEVRSRSPLLRWLLSGWTKIAFFLSLLRVVGLADTIHLSPNGSDRGDGSQNKPYRTLQKAVRSATARDQIRAQPGVYLLKNLTLDKPLSLTAPQGGVSFGDCPTLDFTSMIYVNGTYWSPTFETPLDVSNPEATSLISLGAYLNDGCGNPISESDASFTAEWTASGPAQVVFSPPRALRCNATFAATGDYTLHLAVKRKGVTVVTDQAVAVKPKGVSPFVIKGGADIDNAITTLPVSLLGKALRGTNIPPWLVEVLWSVQSTPNTGGSVVFTSPRSLSTSAMFSHAGDYVLRIHGWERDGLQRNDFDTVRVRVTAPTVVGPAPPPVVDAGRDQRLEIAPGGVVSTKLAGATFLGGQLNNDMPVRWESPPGVTLSSDSAREPRATFSQAGTYVLNFCATANGLTRCDSVLVSVENIGSIWVPGARTLADQFSGQPTSDPWQDIRLTADRPDILVMGASGVEYWLEASEDLQIWAPIGHFVGGEHPVWLTDTERGASSPGRFYRLRRR